MTTLPFYDPHFHLWSVPPDGKPSDDHPHSLATLGDPAAAFPQYHLEHFVEHMTDVFPVKDAPTLVLSGGAFVEALPDDPVVELRWVREALNGVEARKACKDRNGSVDCDALRFVVVGRADFCNVADGKESLETCKEACEREGNSAIPLSGYRHILNFNPTWPFIQDNLLESRKWRDSFLAAVAGGKFRVFDLHCNPWQLPHVVDLLRSNKELFVKSGVSVVVDHMGCLRGDADADTIKLYKGCMAELASEFDFVTVKLSMFAYGREGVCAALKKPSSHWFQLEIDSKVAGKTGAEEAAGAGKDEKHVTIYAWEIIDFLFTAFGSSRLMLASNYPVDHVCGITPDIFFAFVKQFVLKGRTEAEQHDVTHRTAERVYGA